ncbi:MAG: hypothetical protein QXJ75_04640 [Candidatus Bathyarchaeia archaeon]
MNKADELGCPYFAGEYASLTLDQVRERLSDLLSLIKELEICLKESEEDLGRISTRLTLAMEQLSEPTPMQHKHAPIEWHATVLSKVKALREERWRAREQIELTQQRLMDVKSRIEYLESLLKRALREKS